jgi:dienelactone hydrolase
VPEGTQQRAGLLVAQHGSGVDGFMQDAVNRLFRQGYVAAEPELFHRQPASIPEGTTRVGMLKDDEIKPHEFHTCDGASHAFQNFLDGSRYRERPARGTWSEMLAFFAQNLRAAP